MVQWRSTLATVPGSKRVKAMHSGGKSRIKHPGRGQSNAEGFIEINYSMASGEDECYQLTDPQI